MNAKYLPRDRCFRARLRAKPQLALPQLPCASPKTWGPFSLPAGLPGLGPLLPAQEARFTAEQEIPGVFIWLFSGLKVRNTKPWCLPPRSAALSIKPTENGFSFHTDTTILNFPAVI